nr:hypothetical protein [Tanacetum cinerariifolium]
VNYVTRLQALVDKKKVVVTEATIRETLHLDDAEGVDCLPNEQNFSELARMGYVKPSTKLTFYKAFFSSQWKFLIHTILQCMSVKRTSWNEFSSSMASAVICFSSGKKFKFSKYIFDSLTSKLLREEMQMRMMKSLMLVMLLKEMLVLLMEKFLVDEEPSIPSPTPPTLPPQPPQDIPLTSQEHLEFDKVAQALEITKLKRRVKKLEGRNKGRMIAEMDQDDAVVLEDDKEEDREVDDAVKDVEEAKVDENAQDQGRQAESLVEIYKIDMDHANKVLSIQEDDTEPDEVQEVVDVVITAKLITKVVTATSETVTAASAINTAAEAQVPAVTLTAAPVRFTATPSRRRKGVVIKDPEEESTTSTIIPAETKSKDKGKGILVEGPKPLKKKQQIKQDKQYARELQAKLNKNIDWDEAIDHVKRKAKEDPAVKRYQVLKRKPQTEAQSRKNMLMYLKNVVHFKIDYFKGMSYDDIHPIFKDKFNLNTKEHIEEDKNRALKRLKETPAKRAAKRQNLDEEKTQRNVHGPAVVKGWKLLESCGVQIITFTSTQLILLVKSKYPLIRLTLDQMQNAVRLEVEEESKVSLELLRFTRQQHQEGQLE